jgi:hypothetical protein
MGILHRDFAPDLSPVEGPEVDDGSREELAEYYKEQSDTLCRSCGNASYPLETKAATSCVEYYPLNPTET